MIFLERRPSSSSGRSLTVPDVARSETGHSLGSGSKRRLKYTTTCQADEVREKDNGYQSLERERGAAHF